MSRQGHDSSFPNQLYGWQIETDGSWSLYSEDGTLLISTTQTAVLVHPPTSNPHVVGVLWNNNGTPAISNG